MKRWVVHQGLDHDQPEPSLVKSFKFSMAKTSYSIAVDEDQGLSTTEWRIIQGVTWGVNKEIAAKLFLSGTVRNYLSTIWRVKPRDRDAISDLRRAKQE